MKKRHVVESWPKVYHIPADLKPLEKWAKLIISQSRSYYRNRPVHLIGTGKRCIKKKGHSNKR
jgi:hypothetical protein